MRFLYGGVRFLWETFFPYLAVSWFETPNRMTHPVGWDILAEVFTGRGRQKCGANKPARLLAATEFSKEVIRAMNGSRCFRETKFAGLLGLSGSW